MRLTDYTTIDFSRSIALPTTRSSRTRFVRDVPLPSGKTLALITLDNGRDHTRPNTLGPATLLELADVLDAQKERAASGEIARRRHHRQAVHPRRRRRPLARSATSRAGRSAGSWRSSGTMSLGKLPTWACRRSSSSTGSRSAAAWRSP